MRTVDDSNKILVEPDPSYRTHAACRTHETSMFYDKERFVEAFKVCATCPVTKECLSDAVIENEAIESVWGGMTYRQRTNFARGAVLLIRCKACGCWMNPIKRVSGARPQFCYACQQKKLRHRHRRYENAGRQRRRRRAL